jgi:leader peptidase (prepilin peptidase) / N-methyltransferase
VDVGLIVACLTAGVLAATLARVVVHRTCADIRARTPGGDERSGGRASGVRPGLLTGVVVVAVGLRVGWDWSLPAYLLFAWALPVIAAIDANTGKIPNRLTYPLAPVLAGLLVAAAALGGRPWPGLQALLGGVAAFGLLLLVAVITPRGMGMGDVKFAGIIGLGLGYLGWAHVLVGVVAGFLLASVVLASAMALGVCGRKDLVPFGPYLTAGALLALLAGEPLIAGYRALVGW